jgi:hypothetical protein
MLLETMRLYVAVLLLASYFRGVCAQYEEVLPKNPRVQSTPNLLQGGWGQELRLDGSCQDLDSI